MCGWRKVKPILDAFLAWLETQERQVLPKSALGQAVSYCLKQWTKLVRYVEDGHLEIDNNRSERSLKPFVIGRKNWLFANTPRGARASATAYSIVETAKENGLNPMAYLTYLFEQLPNVDLHDEDGAGGAVALVEDATGWSSTRNVNETQKRPCQIDGGAFS